MEVYSADFMESYKTCTVFHVSACFKSLAVHLQQCLISFKWVLKSILC